MVEPCLQLSFKVPGPFIKLKTERDLISGWQGLCPGGPHPTPIASPPLSPQLRAKASFLPLAHPLSGGRHISKESVNRMSGMGGGKSLHHLLLPPRCLLCVVRDVEGPWADLRPLPLMEADRVPPR